MQFLITCSPSRLALGIAADACPMPLLYTCIDNRNLRAASLAPRSALLGVSFFESQVYPGRVVALNLDLGNAYAGAGNSRPATYVE
jgi:hypothetical protein